MHASQQLFLCRTIPYQAWSELGWLADLESAFLKEIGCYFELETEIHAPTIRFSSTAYRTPTVQFSRPMVDRRKGMVVLM